MADWVTISSLATAGGTLVLATATFASVRSANRAARVAERALLIGIRPVLAPSRLDEDPAEEVTFREGRTFRVDAGTALIEDDGEAIFFVVPLRNVGSGIAVLHGWHLTTSVDEAMRRGTALTHADPDDFRLIQRDLYVPAGDTSFWQGALRAGDETMMASVRGTLESRGRLMVELLYGDHEGGQRAISLFTMTPRDDRWLAAVVRHWSVDAEDPREHPPPPVVAPGD
jgi:hypothetical protein